MQAYTHKHCSWKQRSDSRVKRFRTSAFKAFVLFGFQRDLNLVALCLVFTGLDPFQAVVLFMSFISSAASFFFFSPKSPYRWEPLAWANLELIQCFTASLGEVEGGFMCVNNCMCTACWLVVRVHRQHMQAVSLIDHRCSWFQAFQKCFGIKWVKHLWLPRNIRVGEVQCTCSTNGSNYTDPWAERSCQMPDPADRCGLYMSPAVC